MTNATVTTVSPLQALQHLRALYQDNKPVWWALTVGIDHLIDAGEGVISHDVLQLAKSAAEKENSGHVERLGK